MFPYTAFITVVSQCVTAEQSVTSLLSLSLARRVCMESLASEGYRDIHKTTTHLCRGDKRNCSFHFGPIPEKTVSYTVTFNVYHRLLQQQSSNVVSCDLHFIDKECLRRKKGTSSEYESVLYGNSITGRTRITHTHCSLHWVQRVLGCSKSVR